MSVEYSVSNPHFFNNTKLIQNFKTLFMIWKLFPREDLNPHKQIQSLLCYPYTTGEYYLNIILQIPLFLVKKKE